MSELKTYSYDEAYRATLAYFDGDELAARVWVNKYAMKDSAGNIYEQTPTDMHWRIANEIARIENNYDNPMSAQKVFDVIDHFRYIVPAGSPMTGIGNNHQVASLSNCFVIGLDGDADSYGAIMRIDEHPAQTDRLPLSAIVHEETYADYTPERIDAAYAEKEATEENRHFVEINNVQTLAQIFTDIRYTRKDNEAISATLIKALRRQGFLDDSQP